MKHISHMLFASITLLASTSIAADMPKAPKLKQKNSTSKRPQHVVMPEAAPRVKDGADMFFTADFLLWEAREENLSFALTGIGATTDISVTDTGTIFEPRYHYDPGLRVGTGVGIGHDGWEVRAFYTWYQQNKHTNTVNRQANSPFPLTPTTNTQLKNIYLTQAHSGWSTQLNTIDFHFGRDFFISKYVGMRPFAGLKTVWQTQEKDTYYVGDELPTNNYILNLTSKSFGIGLSFGNETTWYITKAWSLVSSAQFSLLSSRYKSTYPAKQFDRTAPETILYIQNYKSINNINQPVLELYNGIRWDNWFSDDRYHLGLHIGWDMNTWFSNYQIIEPAYDGGAYNHAQMAGANMSIMGLKAGGRFDF